jgi:hypothetical protein
MERTRTNSSISDKLNSVTTIQRDLLGAEVGHIVFNTDTNQEEVYNGTSWVSNESGTGWATYHDGLITTPTIVVGTSEVKLTIDGEGSASLATQLPSGSAELWDDEDFLIIPNNNFDMYILRLDLTVDSKTGSPTAITTTLDIGASEVTPLIPIVVRDITTTKTTPFNISISYPVYTGTTFNANGGRFFLKVDTGTVTIGARSITLAKIHSGR